MEGERQVESINRSYRPNCRNDTHLSPMGLMDSRTSSSSSSSPDFMIKQENDPYKNVSRRFIHDRKVLEKRYLKKVPRISPVCNFQRADFKIHRVMC